MSHSEIAMSDRSFYLDLIRRRSRVRFPRRPGGGRSSARWARAQCHIVGVLPPLPWVDHEVAETRAGRRHVLRVRGLDRGGFDDGHQNSFWRVVAKNNLGMLAVGHCIDARIPEFSVKAGQMCHYLTSLKIEWISYINLGWICPSFPKR